MSDIQTLSIESCLEIIHKAARDHEKVEENIILKPWDCPPQPISMQKKLQVKNRIGQHLILIGLNTLLVLFLLLGVASPAAAHPADQYLHNFQIDLFQDEIVLDWTITPGPLLARYAWFETDVDQDDTISDDEVLTFFQRRMSQLDARINSTELKWEIREINWPSTVENLELGKEEIHISLRADWDLPTGLSSSLFLKNQYGEVNNTNLFSLHANAPVSFKTPVQQGASLHMEVSQSIDNSEDWMTDWDSSTPNLSVLNNESQSTAPTNSTTRSRLRQLIETASTESSPGFYLSAFALAIVLGMLHAFTPGHGKSIVAAYMVGSKGNWFHSIFLGSVIAVTHTGTVILIGLMILGASNLIMPSVVFPIFEVASGLLILCIGMLLLIQRWKFARQRQKTARTRPDPIIQVSEEDDSRAKIIIQEPIGEDAPPHPHIGPKYIPRNHRADTSKLEWKTLLALGTSGGLVPCPDAVAILLIATASNRTVLGGLLIFAFSLGISAVLVGIGLAAIRGKQFLAKFQTFKKMLPYAPLISALIVLLLGVGLTYSAIGNLTANSNPDGLTITAFVPKISALQFLPAFKSGFGQERIAYLDADDNEKSQVFITQIKDGTPEQITNEPSGIDSFILASNNETIYYTTLNRNGFISAVHQLDTASQTSTIIYQCEHAMINSIKLTPDNSMIMIERTDLPSSKNASTVTSILLFNLAAQEAKPLMNNDQMAYYNPDFSPDMKWLSYASASDSQINIYEINGERSFQIPNQLGGMVNWSPQNDEFLYTDYTSGENGYTYHLFLHNISDGSQLDISQMIGYETFQGIWSPNGEQFAAAVKNPAAGNGTQIWLIESDGEEAYPITDSRDCFQINLKWAKDSQFILYEQVAADQENCTPGIWMINTKTHEETQITNTGRYPVWYSW